MMVITLIEKVYSFLWGDLFQIPLPGGGKCGNITSDYSVDSNRNLFHNPYKILPIRLFPEMVRSLNSKKRVKRMGCLIFRH